MPFQIIRQDITHMQVDAIVNPTNERLHPDGGTDAQIHRAAGPELALATAAICHLDPGTAVITPAFQLPCRYVIHTAGPIWRDARSGEAVSLRSCYNACLRIALEHGFRSLAFPLLSAGTYGFPRDIALRIGTDAIRDFLLEHEMDIFLVVYDPASYAISRRLYANIQSYLDSEEIAEVFNAADAAPQAICLNRIPDAAPIPKDAPAANRRRFAAPRRSDAAPKLSEPMAALGTVHADETCIEDYLQQMEESFRDMLIRKIDERGITDAECYKLANVDRKLFNKIKNQPNYHPGKSTVLALALALRLPEPEIGDMLRKAGYSLSRSSRFDMIVQYFIAQGEYDVFEINETLFAFGQATLGSSIA